MTSSSNLTPGTEVATTGVIGEDFGLLLVAPTSTLVDAVVREVRSVIRQGGGVVVRFTDATKTRPHRASQRWLAR